ncbi:MAG: hypothetical protein ABIG37_03355 [Nanoarchaeota archaeon]|nr:hypothetical protein [Nanoarchaeota archaeon]
MAKLTAWLVSLIGVLLILNLIDIVDILAGWAGWTLALAVLIIGIGKLLRNYKSQAV